MKLIRSGERGMEKPGIIDREGVARDLSGVVSRVDPAALDRIRALDLTELPAVAPGTRLGVPFEPGGKCLAIGANYRDHIEESGAPAPEEPILFSKSDSAINGPYDPVMQPKGSTKMDWEVELSIVIGRPARCVSRQHALRHVLGYTLGIDYSERAFQHERGGQWIKGKACDTFAPLGPWLVTTDEIEDPQKIVLWLEVNGHRHQECSTAKMIASCAELVSYCSEFMTLGPGDVIMTGTPSGVGGAMDPPLYLQPGDVVRAGGTGLGVQEQSIIPWQPLP